MIEVFIVTHGQLGKTLKETAGMISGHANEVKVIGFLPGQGIEDLEESMRAALSVVNKEDGVLCLVDIPGGSPARVVTSMMLENNLLKVVSGVNLGMLVEVLLMRDTMDVYQLAKHAEKSAHESILDLSEIFRNELEKV